LLGVKATYVGYTGGENPKPNYKTVCEGDGHTEAVRVEFDPEEISYKELVENYWSFFVGPGSKAQYRAAIWYNSKEQKEIATQSLEERRSSGEYETWRIGPKAFNVEPAKTWHVAEKGHQYHNRGGIGKATGHNFDER